MSYSSSSTPNPTLETQIGYTRVLDLDPNASATTGTSANSLSTSTINFTTTPRGVWMISGTILATSNNNSKVLKEAYINIQAGGGNTAYSGFKSDDALNYIYLNPSGVFYSNGSTRLYIDFGVRTVGVNTATITVNQLKITKIA